MLKMLKGEDFISFCDLHGFDLNDLYRETVKQIFTNFEESKPIQIVYLEDAVGRRNLSFLLSCFLTNRDKQSVLYSPWGLREDYLDTEYSKNCLEYFEQVLFENVSTMIQDYKNSCEYIISDGLAYHDISKLNSKSAIEIVMDYKNEIKPITEDAIVSIEWMGQRFLSKQLARNRAKCVIFMHKEYKQFCKKTLLFQSPKKVIIDCGSEYDNRETVAFLAQEKENKIYEKLIRHIDNRFDRVEDKIDDVGKRLAEVFDLVSAIQKKASAQKQMISMFSDIVDDEDALESMTEKVIDAIILRTKDELYQIEKNASFTKCRKLVELRMGHDAWNKLDENSRRFLVTAKFIFTENVMVGEQMDYSSICLLASKAFEIELAKRLVTGYEAFLRKEVGSDFRKWPSSLIKIDKTGNLNKISAEEFMLGKCPYIMGFLPKKDKKEAEDNYKAFINYCQKELFKKKDSDYIRNQLKMLDGQIRVVKDKYRNPAAHKESIGMVEASRCIDYILEVERVLKEMLEMFAF